MLFRLFNRRPFHLPGMTATVLIAFASQLSATPLPGALQEGHRARSQERPAHGKTAQDALGQVVLAARASERNGKALEQDLARAGSFETLFGMLASGSFRVRVGARGVATEPLRGDERFALVGSFATLGLPGLREQIDERLLGDCTVNDRIAVLEILGRHGDLGDSERMLSWAQREGQKVRLPRPVREAFGQALRSLLDRRPDATDVVFQLYREANPSLLPSLLGALDAAESPEHLEAVAQLLGAVPAFDLYLLAELASASKGIHYVPSKALAEQVRMYLSHPDSRLVLEAISAVKHLGDRHSVPVLIQCLDRGKSVRVGAAAALAAITGQHLEPTKDAWSLWYDTTLAWWRGEAPKLMGMASRADAGQASRAIQKLSMARMYRHELVAPLERSLQRPEVEIVVLSSAALGHLGSMNAVAPLVKQLEKPSEDIRRAAYLALRRPTGENHGDDPVAWRSAGWGLAGPRDQISTPR